MDHAQDSIETAWQARRDGRYDIAERSLLQVIAVSREAGRRIELIRALKALAHVVRDLGRNVQALELYEEAVALSRLERDPLLLAHTLRHLGDVHRETGSQSDAERYYHEALALYRTTSGRSPGDFANALRPAAILKELQGETKAARELWAEARRFYQEAGVTQGVEECESRLSQLG